MFILKIFSSILLDLPASVCWTIYWSVYWTKGTSGCVLCESEVVYIGLSGGICYPRLTAKGSLNVCMGNDF